MPNIASKCVEKKCVHVSFFFFPHGNDTQGHHVVRMVCRRSGRIEGLEKLPGEAGYPEGSCLSIKGLHHEELNNVFKVTYLYIQLNLIRYIIEL